MTTPPRLAALRRALVSLSALGSRLPPPLNDPRLRLRLQVGAAIALAVGFFVYIILFLDVLAPLDALTTDFLYHPAKANPNLVIIAVDRKSLDEIGPWPWPRGVHAALLDRLAAAPPRVVAFDLLFALPAPEDSSFAALMERSGNVLLASAGVEAAAYPLERNALPGFDVIVLPDSALRDAAVGVGHRLVTPDPDEIVRRAPLAIQSNGTRYPALGLAAAASFLGVKDIQYDLPQRRVTVGTRPIEVDTYGRALINFTSPGAGIPTYSYSDVFRGSVPASTFTGKVIFVGGTSSIEAEDYATPLNLGNVRSYNVNIEADLANMILSDPPQTLQQQGALEQLGLILLVALLAGITLPHVRVLYGSAITLILLVLLLLFAFEWFNHGIIIEILYPVLSLLLTAGCVLIYRYFSEERRRQFMAALFRRYVPAETVGRVVDAIDRGELPLGGTRRMVTVLYADLRGFAALSEGLAPEALLALVNHYFELMMKAIQAQGGTVSKPMGDALVAIWNAPLDQPNHAQRGLHAAVDIRRNIDRFQQGRRDEDKLNFGIGLATGWAVLGNITALGKVEYTLVGDTVNIAQRISAFANNNQILSDTRTAQDAPDDVETRELSPVRVRGRKEPLPVWEIRGQIESPEEAQPEDE